MTDPNKTFWGDVHKKSTDELFASEGAFFPYTAVLIILYTDRNSAVIHAEYPAVADRYPVCISAKVVHDGLGPCERFPDVRDPGFIVAGIQEIFECITVAQRLGLSFKGKLPICIQLFDSRQKLPSEKQSHRLPRKKKAIAFLDPVVILIQAAAGN